MIAKEVVDFYNCNLDFDKLKAIKIRENTNWNYSYFPVIFETEKKLLEIQSILNDNQIFPRRYFSPSLNTLKYVANSEQIVSDNVSKKILCLPLFNGLDQANLEKIVKIVNL